MQTIQSIHPVPFRTKRNLLAAGLLAFALAACSNSAEKAAEAGALADYHLRNGNLLEARRAIGEAIEEKDDIVDLHLLRGRIEFAGGNRTAAFNAYYNALALDPLNSEALQAVSQIGVSTGNIREAEDAADRILSISPGQPDALLVKGLIALARRREGEALRFAEEALTLQPGNENASILKARALYLQGKPDEALAAIGGSGEGEGPISEGVALTRLEIFRQKGDAAGMAREFTRLRNLRPADSNLRLDEANFRFKREEPAAADDLLLQVLTQPEEQNTEQGITSAEVARQAVAIWQQHGSHSMASPDWAQIASSASPDAREVVARYLLQAGKSTEAGRIIASLNGNTRRALAARLQVATGDLRGGATGAAAVLKDDATHCDALVAQSEAQLALGRPELAVRAGQRAAAECPDRTEAAIAAALAYTAFERPAGSDPGVCRCFQRQSAGYRTGFRLCGLAAEPGQGPAGGRHPAALHTRQFRHPCVAGACMVSCAGAPVAGASARPNKTGSVPRFVTV